MREGNSLPRLALRDRRIFAADRRFRGTADTKASSVRAEARIRLSLEACAVTETPLAPAPSAGTFTAMAVFSAVAGIGGMNLTISGDGGGTAARPSSALSLTIPRTLLVAATELIE